MEEIELLQQGDIVQNGERKVKVKVNVESFFPDHIQSALKNDPPGSWMPDIPKGYIRLNAGYPAPNLIPVDELKTAVIRVLEEEQDLPLHYIGSPRIKKLKKQIQQRMVERRMNASGDRLLITSGAGQAIDLAVRILIDQETVVALEAPTYMEALEIFRNYTQHFISVPVDEHGLQTNLLEKVLADRSKKGLAMPRLLYTIPTFQNPTGTTMTADRRQHVLELAAKYNFLILEDDAYGELNFSKSPPTLKAMDQTGNVLHIGSLSKVVAPGMRIGWITGASEMITAAAWFKKDLGHPFAHAVMATFLEDTDFGKRVDFLKGSYRTRCSILISALEQYLPDSVSWYVPQGGYFVWVKIPGVDTSRLLKQALSEGVSYVPGKYFFLNQKDGTEFLRLSFSYADEQDMVKGVEKLGKVVASRIKPS